MALTLSTQALAGVKAFVPCNGRVQRRTPAPLQARRDSFMVEVSAHAFAPAAAADTHRSMACGQPDALGARIVALPLACIL